MIKCKINNLIKKLLLNTTLYFLVCSLISDCCFSQLTDTIIPLHEVQITSIKNKQFRSTKKFISIDSLSKLNFVSQSIADLLSTNSSIFIKNYGPGNLSTASFRGGNASQSPVIWNGFNIQNPMLGQIDFSQLPSFLFDQVNIEYGGSSAVWGSGALSGSIHLNSLNKFNQGLRTLLQLGIGSFESKKINSHLHYSTEKFCTTTKVYFNSCLNNYNYRDSILKQQQHANYEIKGFMQEFKYLFLKNHSISMNAWYNSSFRNLPSVLGNSNSSANQIDENLKITGNWHFEHKKFAPSIRFAIFNDQLNYTDSTQNIFSKNKTNTKIIEGDIKYKISHHHNFYIGFNYTDYSAISSNYLDQKSLLKNSILASYDLNLIESRLKYEIQIRQEFSPQFQIPLTGNTGLSYQIITPLQIKLNGAKVYRLPTLNDLYWPNGGNLSLKPEEGYTMDAGFSFLKRVRNLTFTTEMTYFYKSISNWISWVPGPSSHPTPINLAKVFSRGTETNSEIICSKKNFVTKVGFNSTYVLSTIISSNLINDGSVNKQLIYTPRYNYGGTLQLSYSDFNLSYYYNYIGYRFTLSDNSSWLQPYSVSTIKIAYQFKFKNLAVLNAFSIHNLFNENYYIVAQRPMPLRNYEFSLTLTYHKSKLKENNPSFIKQIQNL